MAKSNRKIEDFIHKEAFTTGEAGLIAKLSQQTIIRCFDNGTLKGFRVPGSKFRRIPREKLFEFMEDNGIPFPPELGISSIVVLTQEESLIEKIKDATMGGETVQHCANSTELGFVFKTSDVIVVDVRCAEGLECAEFLVNRFSEDGSPKRIVLVKAEFGEFKRELPQGFCELNFNGSVLQYKLALGSASTESSESE